jgi:hypothetical protein
LLVFALLAVPVMFFVKPIILWRQHKSQNMQADSRGHQTSTNIQRQRTQVLDEGFCDEDSLQNDNVSKYIWWLVVFVGVFYCFSSNN